jgi:hypothetical protein
MNWKVWLQGLVAAAIGGGATAVSTMVIDPESFNFGPGMKRVGLVAFLSALISVSAYLKQSPIPGSGSVARTAGIDIDPPCPTCGK